MREIKFRAWDESRKVMELVLMIWLNGTGYGLQTLGGNVITLTTTAAKEGIKLMQFTGLLDKNGKEIYEGDIVKGDYPDKGVVNHGEHQTSTDYYADRAFGWFIEDKKGDTYGLNQSDYEVIGNIYENPELLTS